MKIVKNKHIGVYGIIIEKEKIVLIRKARGGYKGKLDLPGGGMEHKELPIETLKRELMEEVGVDVIKEELFDVTSTNIKWQMTNDIIEDLHHIGILYITKIQGELKSEADGHDSLGSRWYEINSLMKDELTPFAIYGLEKMGYKLH